MSPVGPQARLGTDEASAANDEAASLVGGLGNLGDAVFDVVDRAVQASSVISPITFAIATLAVWTAIVKRTPRRARTAIVSFDQNPESHLSTISPDAPARRRRGSNSSMKRCIPREVCAEPLRIRACNTSPVSLRAASERVIATDLRVTEGRALLLSACHLADRRVDVDHEAIVAWSRPHRPGTPQHLGRHGLELADVAEGEGPEEGPERRGRHHLVTEHRRAGAGAQHVCVVDMARTRHDRVHEREDLSSGERAAESSGETDRVVYQLLIERSAAVRCIAEAVFDRAAGKRHDR